MTNSFLPYAVDWSATGDMLAGIGTLIGAGVLIWATKKGRETVADWRSQKLLDREITVAEEALTAAYEVRSAIYSTRGRGISEGEVETAKSQLEGKGFRAGLLKYQTAQALLNRLHNRSDHLEKLFTALPKVKAYIGDHAADEIDKLVTQWNHTALDIEFMTEFDRDERKAHMEKFHSSEEGSTLAETDAAVKALEEILLPKLRPHHIKSA